MPNAEKLKTKLVVKQYGSNPNPNNWLRSVNGFLLHLRIYNITKYVIRNHFLMTRYFSPHIPWLALCIPVEWISEQLVVTANISAGTYVHSYHGTTTYNFTFRVKNHSQNVNIPKDFNRGARTNEKKTVTLPELLHTFCTLRLNTSVEEHLKRTMK